MDETKLPQELAERFIHLLKERTATNDADDVRERFQKTYDLLTGYFHSHNPNEREPHFQALAAQLADPTLPIWEFACAANTCGIAVEHGSDPGHCVQPILDRLTGQLAGAAQLHARLTELIGVGDLEMVPEDQWDELANRSPDVARNMREFLGIVFNGRAAMAMLARSAEVRRAARQRTDLLEAATASRTVNRYSHYVAEVLQSVDGDDVVVIDLESKLGFLVRLHAVRNNAHLFTLLQATLLELPVYRDWKGAKPHPIHVSLARSERMADSITEDEWAKTGLVNEKGQAFDQALWQFYQWPAMQPDGTVETWDMAHPYHPWWVWGELSPNDIVEIDGMKIILLAKPEMPRQWEQGFFVPIHPALKPRIEVRSHLSADSVKGWLERIRSMPRQPNPLPPAGVEVEEQRAQAG